MHCPLGRCCSVSVGLGVLWLLITLDIPRGVEDDQARMAVKVQVVALPSLRGFGLGRGVDGTRPSHGRAGGSEGWVWTWWDALVHREADPPPPPHLLR